MRLRSFVLVVAVVASSGIALEVLAGCEPPSICVPGHTIYYNVGFDALVVPGYSTHVPVNAASPPVATQTVGPPVWPVPAATPPASTPPLAPLSFGPAGGFLTPSVSIGPYDQGVTIPGQSRDVTIDSQSRTVTLPERPIATPGNPPLAAAVDTVNAAVLVGAEATLASLPPIPAQSATSPAVSLPAIQQTTNVNASQLYGSVQDYHAVLAGQPVTVPLASLGQSAGVPGYVNQTTTQPITVPSVPVNTPAVNSGPPLAGAAAGTEAQVRSGAASVAAQVPGVSATVPGVDQTVTTPAENRHFEVPQTPVPIHVPNEAVGSQGVPVVPAQSTPPIPRQDVAAQGLPGQPAPVSTPSQSSITLVNQDVPVNVGASCFGVPWVQVVDTPEGGSPNTVNGKPPVDQASGHSEGC